MFKLNKVIRTKDGELVKPFDIQGETVFCAKRNGETIKKSLSDFDFEKPKVKEIISVIQSKLVKKTIPEPVPSVEPEPVPSVEPEPVPSVEPEPVPSVEPEPVNIWNNVGDDYI